MARARKRAIALKQNGLFPLLFLFPLSSFPVGQAYGCRYVQRATWSNLRLDYRCLNKSTLWLLHESAGRLIKSWTFT